MPAVAPLDRCIRITAGKPEDLSALAEALPEALDAARRDVPAKLKSAIKQAWPGG
jgi:histidinol-phosphate aminotransferase